MLSFNKNILVKKADTRSIKMFKNSAAMCVIKGLSILLSLLSAPIMLNHVNRADYGVLLTLTSIVSWVGVMDIGLGNGLRNKLSEFLAKKEYNKAREAVSSCYAALFIYISILLVIFFLLSPKINWLNFLNSPTSDITEIRNLANVIFFAFCVQFFLNLINSILFAFQIPALQSLLYFLGQVLTFIALIIQVFVFNVTSVFQIGAVNCLMPLLVLGVASVVLFSNRLRLIAPSLKMINLKSVSGIISLGMKFFVLQIISVVIFQANSIIISKVLNPETVVEYNLAFKYTGVLTIIFNIIVTPMWSATTEAYVKNDFLWIKNTLKVIRKVSLGIMLLGGIMVIFSQPIYNLWLGSDSIDIHFTTTLLIYISVSFEILYRIYGTIINGTGKVFAQMIFTGIIAICYIPCSVKLGSLFGLSGILFTNIIVFILNYIWSKIQCYKLLNQTASGIWIR